MSLPPLDFTGAGGFEPNSGGGGSDILTHDGHYAVKIAKATAGMSKAGNAQVEFEVVVEDADNKGKRVKSWCPYTGNDRKGRPNAQRLFQVLASTGTDKSKLTAMDGKSLAIEEVCKMLEGRIGYVEISAEKSMDGQYWNSNVRFWNVKQRYEDQKAVGAHRRPISPECAAWQRGGPSAAAPAAAAPGTNGAAGVAQPPPAAAPQPAGNPLL